MKLTEKTLAAQTVYQGKIIDLHVDQIELENGHTATREVIEHSGGVCVAALTPQNELLFVKQFRYPYKEVLLELPAGKRDKTESPLECGKRELLEETGAIGMGYLSLGKLYPTPGYCGEIIHLYLCRIAQMSTQQPDEDEFLQVEKIPLIRAAEMVLNNEIPDAKTQVAVLKAHALVAAGKY